jgi:acyl-coenzyme A synthetase/AMP-(fatty) acid ligase
MRSLSAIPRGGPSQSPAAPGENPLDVPWQNITDPIFRWAAERPQAPAFIQFPETVSYDELATLVGKAAVHLDGIGIRQGDRIAINLTNSIDHFILTLGLLRLGATTMEIAYSALRPASAELLRRFAIKRIFIEPTAAPITGCASIRIDAGWRSVIASCHGNRPAADDGDGVFNASLSSGTTGEPTGSMMTHRQLFQRVRAQAELFAESGVLSTERPATFLLAASIGFSFYFRSMISQLVAGGPVAILPEYLYTIDLVKTIGAWDDAFCLIPSAACRVLVSCAPDGDVLLPRLRALAAAGGFLYPEEKLAVLARVTPNFYDIYGASGFGTIAVLSPAQMRARPHCVGRPPSCVEVQVVDEAGRPLPPGATGRLRCRGTQGSGIGEVDAADDERLRDGWFYPGDSAHIDEQGYIVLKGRAGEIIHRNGRVVFAADIEAAIAQHPAVGEVAVVGVPRMMPGEEIVALVAPRGPLPHEVLAQHCRDRLSPEHWPDRIFYASALPKTAAGKLDHAAVKAMVMDEIARRAGPQRPPAQA